MMSLLRDLLTLIEKVPKPPEERLERCTDEEIASFEKKHNFKLPPELKDWLRFANGPCIGPGGFFGIKSEDPELDISMKWRLFPSWKEKQWIPIAGDGNGNYYVLDSSNASCCPVLFIDVIRNSEEPAYIAASGFWPFLYFVLNREVGRSTWPFDKDHVLTEDPDLKRNIKYPFPWEL